MQGGGRKKSLNRRRNDFFSVRLLTNTGIQSVPRNPVLDDSSVAQWQIVEGCDLLFGALRTHLRFLMLRFAVLTVSLGGCAIFKSFVEGSDAGTPAAGRRPGRIIAATATTLRSHYSARQGE